MFVFLAEFFKHCGSCIRFVRITGQWLSQLTIRLMHVHLQKKKHGLLFLTVSHRLLIAVGGEMLPML